MQILVAICNSVSRQNCNTHCNTLQCTLQHTRCKLSPLYALAFLIKIGATDSLANIVIVTECEVLTAADTHYDTLQLTLQLRFSPLYALAFLIKIDAADSPANNAVVTEFEVFTADPDEPSAPVPLGIYIRRYLLTTPQTRNP